MSSSEFARTRAALNEYDGGKASRDALADAADTNEAIAAWLAVEKAAEDKVREAFAADTADRNSRENAFLVHPNDPWLRSLVSR